MLVVPAGLSEDVVAVLGDYSAVGMLDPFAWVAGSDTGTPTTPARFVEHGQSEAVVLQQLLTNARYDRVRVVVLVPVDAGADGRVPLAAEQFVEQVVRSSSVGARIGLLRMLLTPGGQNSAPPADDESGSGHVVLEGWHNLLVAPEDSPAPGFGAVPWGPMPDQLDVAQRIAPVIAGVTGLWSGVEGTPFDTLEILPGKTVRAVRAFYRHLDTTDIEAALRTKLFDPTGRLPLPRGGQVPVVQIEDVPSANQAMAAALWRKHRDVLRGPRVTPSETDKQPIKIMAALKLFFSFLGAGLRKAPGAWWSGVTGSVTGIVTNTIQGGAFGGKESAFEVVSNAELASWQDLGQNAEALSHAIGGPTPPEQIARQDLSALWNDFVCGALTLSDGGRRAQGLEPIAIGSAVGVLPNASDAVPSRAEQFAAIPTSLAAVIGLGAVEPADVLGVATVRDRLQRTYADPAAGVEARTTGAELDSWQQRASRSYAWQVSSILVDYLDRSHKEVAQLVGELRTAAKWTSADERLRARQQAISVVLKTLSWAVFGVVFLIIGAAAIADLSDKWWLSVSWVFVLTIVGVLIVLYVLVSLSLFLLAQRDLFAELNLRRTQLSKIEAMQTNLKTALQDVSRLSTAYGQLLSWSRVVGPLLRAPFGHPPPARPGPGHLDDGLPRSTQVGIADPGADERGDASHDIERALFPLGWLSQPWQGMVSEAAERLREEPSALFRMPGAGTGSGLDQWSSAVAAGHVQPTGAEALWTRVEQMFVSNGRLNEVLTRQVRIPVLGRVVSAQQFGEGFLDHRPGRAAPFDTSLFTHSAMTAGHSAVAVDAPALSRRGLGYHASVVQVSDGLPPYDYALFAAAIVVPPNEERTTAIRVTERDATPPGEGMVF